MRTLVAFFCLALSTAAFAADAPKYEYRVLATTRTSTMEKEMNQAGAEGFVFSAVMGGETAFGGKEVVVVMVRKTNFDTAGKTTYRLLATSRTSTMQKELQQAAEEGFDYCGQTVFESAFGGKEVSLILQRSSAPLHKKIEFKLLATSKTSTMQKELNQAGADGFETLGMAVGKTAMGGNELVSILRRYAD